MVVTACFTEKGTRDFLELNGHNLQDPRVVIYSGYRNAEWQKVRDFLIGLASEPATAGVAE